tara:strand:+ start:216 stop:1325 length:1110 start_codon:yes stop_codon:yes gene_type:complete
MFKDISPDDRSIKEFKTYKQFTFTNSDSGSGVFGLEGLSGSFHNFLTGSAASQSFGVYNEDSKSLGKSWDTWYSMGTFFKLPLYYQIRNSYYQYDKIPNPKSTVTRFPIYSGGNWSRKYPYNREDWGSVVPRELHNSVNVITIPQQYFGEEVKPYSIKIIDDSSAVTVDLRDDGYGQLYDYAYSSSFASGTPDANGSGSCIGNVFYEHGIISITNTGSRYTSVGLGTGADGWSVRFQATKTSYEYQYQCNVGEYQFTGTTNPSTVVGRSGSIIIPADARYSYTGRYDDGDPKYENTIELVLPPGTSSYESTYSAGNEYKSFTTHSEFGTYITNIGLYNPENELLAMAKLSNPIKNDKDLPLSFLVRFDS